ncbi:MAG: hypothetical protein J5I65_02500 [Aridibacter famidurans]|nr:hypothetical protein [Aridibacter famidurans]
MNICPKPNFIDYFRSPFVYIVLVASVAASFAVLASRPIQKFEQYAIELEIGKFTRSDPSPAELEEFEFVFCCFGGCGPDLLDVAAVLGEVLMTFLFLLPAIGVLAFISLFYTILPGFDPAHYQAAASIAFIFYTSYYWLSIGYLIYNTPGDWGPFREDLKMLSILDDKKN